MDFFRRIFNNPSESDSQTTQQSVESPDSGGGGNVQQNDASAQSSVKLDEGADMNPASSATEVEDTILEEDNRSDTVPMTKIENATTKTDPLKSTPVPEEIPLGVTRPLPQEPILPTNLGHLIFGQSSDVGMVRTNNQDAAMSFFFTSDSVDSKPDFGVFILADGMGGHKEGEKASAITAKIVMQQIFQNIYLPMLTDEAMDSERMTITEALSEAVGKANAAVRKEVKDGGTTLTAVVVLGDQAYIGHVGDSRAYMVSSSTGVEQLTRDHSVVQRLIELEQLTPEEAETHEQRNVLYRAIGQNEEVEVDILRRRLPANSQLLLCSDGLWGLIEQNDLRDIVLNTPDPQEACDKLIALANTNGGTDNITAILLKMPTA